MRALRRLGEPITLFGESEWQRYKRYARVEREHAGKQTARGSNADGQKDDFGAALRALAADETGGALKQILHGAKSSDVRGDGAEAKPLSAAERAVAAYAEQERRAEYERKRKITADAFAIEDVSSLSGEQKNTAIAFVLRRFLDEWEEHLHARSDAENKSAQGRVDTATFVQVSARACVCVCVCVFVCVLCTGSLMTLFVLPYSVHSTLIRCLLRWSAAICTRTSASICL